MMNAIVEIDNAGRIVIPKKMREQLRLRPGTRLRIETEGDRLSLEQAIPEAHLEMRDGLLVMAGGATLTLEEANEAMRRMYRERDRRLLEGSGLE